MTVLSSFSLQIQDPFAGTIVQEAKSVKKDTANLGITIIGLLYGFVLLFSLYKMIFGETGTGVKVFLISTVITGIIIALITTFKI